MYYILTHVSLHSHLAQAFHTSSHLLLTGVSWDLSRRDVSTLRSTQQSFDLGFVLVISPPTTCPSQWKEKPGVMGYPRSPSYWRGSGQRIGSLNPPRAAQPDTVLRIKRDEKGESQFTRTISAGCCLQNQANQALSPPPPCLFAPIMHSPYW